MTEQDSTPDRRYAAAVMPAMLVAVVALASSSILITGLERLQVPALVIAFYRMAITTVLFLPAALLRKREEITSLGRKDWAALLLGGLCLAVHFGAWIKSLEYIPIATSVVLVNSHPLFVVAASYLFLGERPRRRVLLGAAIGLCGMAIISHEGLADFQAALKGDALAVTGALAVAGYFIVGRKARAQMSLVGYVTPVYVACSVFLLIWTLVEGASLGPYAPVVWAYLAALAVVPTIIGHTIFNWALKHVRPTAISVTFLGEPVVASLLALIFFGQRPPMTTLIGGALVLAGIYLSAK